MNERPALTRLPGTPEPMHHWPGHGGVRIAGDAWGPPDGPLVLLQHGGGQTRHAWKGTGETLGAAGYHAVAFDARGHGDSDWAPDGLYGQDAMVRDLQCVVAALGQRRPVLVDIAPRVEPAGVDHIQAFMRLKPEGFASLEEVAQAIGTYQPHRRRPPKLDGLAKNLRLGADGRYHWHWDPRYRAAGINRQ